MPKYHADIQGDLDILEQCTNKNLMQINNGKCKALAADHMLTAAWVESSFAEKSLSVLVVTKWNEPAA